jgi:hypothetical protein
LPFPFRNFHATILGMHPGMRLAVALLIILLPIPSAASDWVRVETRNFIVYGETGESRVREVASEFERFREALGRIIPGADTPAAVPTVVVVFGSQNTFAPYRPRFNGKPISLGGYFFANEDTNIVSFPDVDRAQSLRTIFHEYVHLVLANATQGLPIWLSEGLAEYYSTFEVLDNGRRAVVGRTVIPHLQLLNKRRLMPIPELLAIETTSSDYNEGTRQSLFYAQSWALVHMLISDAKSRAALSEYTKLVGTGVASAKAWETVFGDQNIGQRLSRYVGQEYMNALAYQFDREIPKVKSDSSAVSRGDAEATLADLVRNIASPDEASTRFEALMAIQPPSARAKALYGLHALDQNEPGKARRLLLEAARDRSDWLVQYHVAVGLTQLASEDPDSEPILVAVARDAIAQVLSARPELPHALALRARLDAVARTDLPRALETVRRARTLTPGREDYQTLEAFILLQQGQFAESRRLIEPLLSSVHGENVRESARRMLQQVERAERAAADYLARLEGRANGRGSNNRRSPDSSTSRIVFRKLEEGEQRTEGRLERINCSAAGLSLHIVLDDKRVERFDAASMDRIDFITYRDDQTGVITCGAREPPERVYVTWRQKDKTRQIVAVEFLPE